MQPSDLLKSQVYKPLEILARDKRSRESPDRRLRRRSPLTHNRSHHFRQRALVFEAKSIRLRERVTHRLTPPRRSARERTRTSV